MSAQAQTTGGAQMLPEQASADDRELILEGLRDDLDEPRFRILKRGNWRRAFKLEGIFWTLLERAAKSRSQKLTDYVQELVSANPESRNQSSDLRAHAARWLYRRFEEAERKLEATRADRLLHVVPLPGFIIGEGRGLLAYNGEFSAFIRRAADKERGRPISQARLSLDAPLGRIIEMLSGSARRALDCGFTVALDERRLKGRVRVSLVPGRTAQPDIMGFVITAQPVEQPRGQPSRTGLQR